MANLLLCCETEAVNPQHRLLAHTSTQSLLSAPNADAAARCSEQALRQLTVLPGSGGGTPQKPQTEQQERHNTNCTYSDSDSDSVYIQRLLRNVGWNANEQQQQVSDDKWMHIRKKEQRTVQQPHDIGARRQTLSESSSKNRPPYYSTRLNRGSNLLGPTVSAAGGTSEAATTEVAAAAADGESRYRDSPMVVAQASRKTTQISDAQITHAQIAAVAGQRVVDTRPVEQDSVLEVLATAMRVLRCAEKICPLDANTQQNLGVLLFILGHYDQALVYLCKATYNHATSFSLSSIHTLLSVAMDRCCNSLPSSPPHSPTSQNYSQHLPPPCQQPSTSPTNSPVPRSSLSLQLTGCTDSSATATQQTSTIVSTTTEASTTTPQPTTIAATTTSTTTSSATTSTKRPARATRTARGAPSCVGVVPALHSTTAARSPPRRSPRVAATDSDATCRGRGHNNRGGGGGLREGRGVGTGQGKKRGGRR
eukprot:GHVQ01016934.1.p1 GENE.GHVQ01016934.1~~GHVQ01016934.1.p1  ORF type:complete len:480 (+),score=107.61 GHVQ01016934.1:1508-2947(+)